MPALKPASALKSEKSALENGGDAHAPCGADRDQSALALRFIESLRQRGDDACAGRGERMADRNAAALHVEPRAIDGAKSAGQPELVAAKGVSVQALSVHNTCPAKAS